MRGPIKGGAVNKYGQKSSNAINEQTGGRKFPASLEVKKGNARYKSRGNSGAQDTNPGYGKRGYYGDPESRSGG